MESGKRTVPPHPRESTSFISAIFFTWTWILFRNDHRKRFELGDIWQPISSQKSAVLGDRLEKTWREMTEKAKRKGTKPSLMFCLLKTFLKEILYLGVIHVVLQTMDIMMRPYLLRELLSNFSAESGGTNEGAIYAAVGLITTSALTVLMTNHYTVQAFVVGLYLRAACVSLVYRKSLRLSRGALGQTSPGHIVNLVSNDVSRFEMLAFFIHFMWSAPIISLAVGVLLYQEAGIAGVAGVIVVLTIAPIQSVTAKLTSIYRLQTALKTDERIRYMDEVICGIGVIKMYAWEKPFIKILELARKAELKVIRKTGMLRGLYMTFNVFTTRCALACTLITYSLIEGSLKAEKVFVMQAYFSIMAMVMSSIFNRGFAELAECKVSVNRLQRFLEQEEVDAKVLNKGETDNNMKKENGSVKDNSKEISKPAANGVANPALELDEVIEKVEESRNMAGLALMLDNVTASWSKEANDPTLQDINIRASTGTLVGIIGHVGSGKSSLLQMILGEVPVLSGNVNVNGSVSYAAQEAWVFSSTVRQNILFGLDYDKQRYKEVIKACSLERDLDLFSHGDMTVVGERGSSLSGGQQARINLARAVYRKADIYLLDDPLSAVDAHVSKHIFKHCLRGFLRCKTVVLATHQVQYMKNMDTVVVLENGKIKQCGSYEEILEQGNTIEPVSSITPAKELTTPSHSISLTRMISISSTRSERSIGDDISLVSEMCDEAEEVEVKIEANTRYKGSLYWGYLKAGASPLTALLVVILFLGSQVLASTCDYWVSIWTTHEEQLSRSNSTSPGIEDPYKVTYGSLVLALLIVALSRGIAFYLVCNRCSRGIHSNMVNHIIHTPLSFFNKNPSGGILNRFSKDLGGADESMAKAMLDCGQIFGQVIGAMVTSSIVNPWFLLPIGMFIFCCVVIRNYCISSTKNMKRIENMARSPVYSHLSSTLQGLITARAHSAHKYLLHDFDAHQDVHTSSLYTYLNLQQGYSFALDMFGTVYLSFVILSFVFLNSSGVFGSEVGLAITQTITITAMLQWGMRQSSELVNQMTSVERLLAFTNLPPEEPNKGEKSSPPSNWPTSGRIEFKNVSMWYERTENPVFDSLNFTILQGEKIGVVGRTGAGKSSLITALFRLSEVEGEVLVDKLDVSTIQLETLRSRISIIPQNPVLFSGTVRKNLDPFENHPDYVLWRALDEVELKEVFKDGGLESHITEGGSNLSVGQRQLICLARAIVKNNKIIVLDEATASVDPNTDSLIQTTIRKRFRDCTVLTVAHRLQTVIDCDRIMVMDAGRLVEYDSPYLLLQAKGGYFCSLVNECGKAMATQLTSMAQQAYLTKIQFTLEE